MTSPLTHDVVRDTSSDSIVIGSRRFDQESSSKSDNIQSPGIVWRYVLSESGTGKENIVRIKPDEADFNIVISRISHLLHEDEGLQPTDYALGKALSLVYEANQIMGGVFARASAAVDEDGSIFIYWRKPERNIELKIPAKKQGRHHIYYREGVSYGFERNVTANTLAKWLKWFMHV